MTSDDDFHRSHHAWSAPTADIAPLASEALNVDLDGFAGPLDPALRMPHQFNGASIKQLAYSVQRHRRDRGLSAIEILSS